jgi:hypothetical protein
MREYDIAYDIAAQCQRKAKAAQGEDDKHSWLALADSWLQTAELKRAMSELEPRQDRAPVIRAA